MSVFTLVARTTVLADAAYASPNQLGYVFVGWGAIVAGLVLYALLVVRKGRQLAKQVPPEDRRWMS